MALPSFFYVIDPGSMVLIIFFVVIFALLMWILRRTGIGKNNAIATVIGLAISLLATYGLARSNFDLTDLIYSIGISEDIIYIIAPVLALLFIFFLSRKKDPTTGRKKFSFKRFLIILGGLMIVLGFTPLIYQKEFFIIAGSGLILLGLLAGRGRGKNKNKGTNINYQNLEKERNKLASKYQQYYRKARAITRNHNGKAPDPRQFPNDAKLYKMYLKELDKIEKTAMREGIRLR